MKTTQEIARECAEKYYLAYHGPQVGKLYIAKSGDSLLEHLILAAIETATAEKDAEIARLTAERDTLRAENAALRDIMRQVPTGIHPADERGPCLCGQCTLRHAIRELTIREQTR